MSNALFLDEACVRQLVTMEDALAAVEEVSAGRAVRAGCSLGNHVGNSIGPATNQTRMTTAESTVARRRFLF
jgi:hypothetical protein